jgi:PPOX class probable F420-dependent enzyme
MAIGDERHIAFTTLRRSGDAVTTPTWVVPVSDGRVGVRTAMGSGTTRRLENDSRVTLRASDGRGRPREGSPVVSGTAELVQSGRFFDEVQAAVRAKYGWRTTVARTWLTLGPLRRTGLTYADTVVLVRLDD